MYKYVLFFICDVPPTRVNIFIKLNSGYSVVLRISISAVILTPNVSKSVDFRQLQMPNAQSKYYKK